MRIIPNLTTQILKAKKVSYSQHFFFFFFLSTFFSHTLILAHQNDEQKPSFLACYYPMVSKCSRKTFNMSENVTIPTKLQSSSITQT